MAPSVGAVSEETSDEDEPIFQEASPRSAPRLKTLLLVLGFGFEFVCPMEPEVWLLKPFFLLQDMRLQNPTSSLYEVQV